MTAAKGPTKDRFSVVEVKDAPEVYFLVVKDSSGYGLCGVDYKSDADIIADAFNVYAETGLTPREMMEEIARLRGSVSLVKKQAILSINGNHSFVDDAVFYAEIEEALKNKIEEAVNNDRALLRGRLDRIKMLGPNVANEIWKMMIGEMAGGEK